MKLPAPNQLPTYRADIDGLRGLAVLCVVAYHAFPDFVHGGFVGVDIFFVISGYLISGIIISNLQNNTFSFLDFYIRRVRRLFPALVIVIATCYVVGWFLLLPEDYERLGKHIVGGSVFVSNFVLMQESGYFDPLPAIKPLFHLWSLGIEEQFYLIWPLTLYMAWKWRLDALVIVLPLLIVSFALNVSSVDEYTIFTFYSPFTRFWELLIGAMLACAQLREERPSIPSDSVLLPVIAGLGLLLVVCAVFGISTFLPFPGWWALLPTIGTFLLIVSGPMADAGQGTWVHHKILSNPKMLWLGRISYPLYLWHWPLLAYLRIIYMDMEVAPVVFRVCVVLLSVGLAWLTYRFVERPIRFGKQDLAKVGWLVVALETMGALGLVTFLNGGFAFRLPEDIRAFATTTCDTVKEWREHQCFLEPRKHDMFADNGNACVEKGNEPLLFLWGDSHAASLYPGLVSIEKEDHFRLAQFTIGSCPPLLGSEEPFKFCKPYNAMAFAFAEKLHPDIVMLQARWDFQEGDDTIDKLGFTIRELKRIGIPRIILVGPTPRWQYNLGVLAKMYRFKERIAGLVTVAVNREDNALRAAAQKNGIEYLSPFETLCNAEGCLTHPPGDFSQALVFDMDHLSSAGSRVVMQALAKDLVLPGQKAH